MKCSITDMPHQCYGCGMCRNICPKTAIKFIANEKGFYYPLVDREKCINCGLCISVCPIGHETAMMHDRPSECFGVKNTDSIRLLSSSGGVFTAIFNEVVKNKQGGVCLGVRYDEKFHASYRLAEDLSEFRGSKYIQAELDRSEFEHLLNHIKEKRKVLISGTPCLITGIKTYFQKENIDIDNVIFVDIVCHGVPSPRIWHDYIKDLEESYASKLIKFTFRDKSKGWRGYHVKAEFENGLQAEEDSKAQAFIELFKNDCILRESCYNCPFSCLSRTGDITIGDFWGIEDIDQDFSDNSGISLVLTNTEKGRIILSKCISSQQLDVRKYNSRVIVQRNLHRHTEKGFKYKDFWRTYKNNGYEGIANKFITGGRKYKYYYYMKALYLRIQAFKN